MIAYFDASAIVKVLIAEEDSEQAARIWDTVERLYTSTLSYTECRAALAAAKRAGRLTENSLGTARFDLERAFMEVDYVDVTRQLVRAAGDLADTRALPGYDAVHLASALVLGSPDVTLVTWDRDLAAAGRELGFDLAGIRLR